MHLLKTPDICNPVLSSIVPNCLELINFFKPSIPPFLKDIWSANSSRTLLK